MFRIAFLVLALAVYGAYSLLSSVWSSGAEAAAKVSEAAVASVASETSEFSLSSATDLAAGAAAKLSGLDLKPLPAEGCSESVLSPQEVMNLLDQLPGAQRTALAKLLNASSSVWTAQLYSGESGVGLCLPAQGKLLSIPGLSLPSLDSAISTLDTAVSTAVKSIAANEK